MQPNHPLKSTACGRKETVATRSTGPACFCSIVLDKPSTMNEFFIKYVDLTALLLTVLIPFLITFKLKQKAQKKIRAVPVYFLVFGPAGILTFMFFHLFENSYHVIEKVMKGTFVYDFRFYSLMLLGIVVGYLGIQLLKACNHKCLQEEFQNRRYLWQILLVLLFTVPLVPITPIAFAPVILCTISLSMLPLVKRKEAPIVVEYMEKAIAVPVY